MRVGHDEPVPRHPAAPLDPEAAGGADQLHHAAAGGLDVRIPSDGAVGGPYSDRRAGDLGEGVEAGKRPEDGAGRRQRVVEPAQDRRSLDGPAQVPRSGGLQRDGPGHPRERQAQAREEQPAADAVEHSEPLPQAVAQVKADDLEAGREDAPDEQGADQREEGRIGRPRGRT